MVLKCNQVCFDIIYYGHISHQLLIFLSDKMNSYNCKRNKKGNYQHNNKKPGICFFFRQLKLIFIV